MSLTAPYTNSMRIGQGFNTYTQEIRLENAVLVGNRIPKKTEPTLAPPTGPVTPPITPDVTAPTKNPIEDIPQIAINGDAPKTPGLNTSVKTVSRPSTPPQLGSAADVVSEPQTGLPFEIPAGPAPRTSQSVTYSTRAIENVSDIMDALNISTSMSIKYGTIHGNGNASFVNENKVLDSELNYVVSVIVNNDAQAEYEDMEFQEISDLPLDRFTEVYGDSFISGFTEGGQFNAIISIKLNDKSKHRAVKQAVDVQLAVGPPTLEVGGSEAFSKEHAEVLKNTEISISVNWIGGGEIKKPGVPWTIQSVVAVANAFPSMVARSSARTQAILTRYTSLRSFQSWKWKRLLEAKQAWEANPKHQKGGAHNKDGNLKFEEPVIILNYVPCSLYTADLFDALMIYKKLWKKIGEILQDTSKYKIRPTPKKGAAKNGPPTPVMTGPSRNAITSPTTSLTPVSPCLERSGPSSGIQKAFTFNVEEGSIGWDLQENNLSRDPIPPDPIALNEARLLCREAMTLITEEASRLVDHPQLAYAEYDEKTKKTQMKRPNYAYPEVLKERLPIPIHNDTLSDLSTDGAYLKTAAYSKETGDIWFDHNMVGDPKLAPSDVSSKFGMKAKYEDFSTLEFTEPFGQRKANPLRRIAIHRYHLPISFMAKPGLKNAINAIGAIGLAYVHDGQTDEGDKCTHHIGHNPSTDANDFRALNLGNVDITQLVVSYYPGSGYIAGITFYDQINGQLTERMRWKQWEGKEPEGLTNVINAPPDLGDGTVWKFVGLTGSWVDTFGQGHVLARISGVWKKDGE